MTSTTHAEAAGFIPPLLCLRIGPIERLPKFWLCVPLVFQWLLLALRYRSLTLPSVVNASIETGGLAGESKRACLDLISADHARNVARTVEVSPGQDIAEIRQQAGLTFPLIAKPDIGWCGYGVRRIDSPNELQAYATSFPTGASLLLQEFIAGPHEAGLFYVRRHAEAFGKVTAMTFRHQPQVRGDGIRTMAMLMQDDPRLTHRTDAVRDNIGSARLQSVPAPGEVVILSTVASLRVGGRYEDATRLITPALNARVQEIAGSMADFHFGRFDVRFSNLAELQHGVFQIIEVNGVGSEAIQYWDPAMGLFEAYRGVFAKQSLMFAVAQEFRAAGRRPIGVVALARAWWRQMELTRGYPASN